MDLNKETVTKIISVAALVVLGYIFFISVYNQIIVQSGGFFYVIIFGGILILAFVLLSLVTKILDISDEVNDNVMWDVVEILMFCFSAYLFLIFRLTYKSSVPAEETIIYRAAALMREKSLSTKGMDMISHLIIYPSQYVYARFLSSFFRLTDTGSGAFITLNAVVLILTAFVMDRVVRKIGGRACGLFAALCTLFIPSQSFAVYSYSSEFFLCFLMVLTFNALLIVTDGKKRDKKRMIVYDAVFGFLLGLLCFTEPLTLVCIISFLIYFLFKRKVKDHYPVYALAVICGVMLVMILVFNLTKASALNKSFGEVVGGNFKRFSISKNPETDEKYTFGEVFKKFHSNLDNQNTNVNDNYLFLEGEDGESYSRTNSAWFTLGTQMSYMFIIVMAIACAYYMLRNKHREVTPCLLLLFGSFIMLLFRSTKENSTYYLFEVLMIIGCSGLHFMYMNHHSDIPVLLSEMASSPTPPMSPATLAGTLARAKALIFVDHSRDKENKIEISAEQTIAQQSMDDQFMADTASPQNNGGIESEFSIFSGTMPDYGDGAFGGQIGDRFGTVGRPDDGRSTDTEHSASGDFIAQSMDEIGRLADQYTSADEEGDYMENMYSDFLYGSDTEQAQDNEYPEEYTEMPEEYQEDYDDMPVELPDDFASAEGGYSDGFDGLQEGFPDGIEEIYEEYPEEYAEEPEEYSEDYPEEYSEEPEEYPEEYAEEPEDYPEEYNEQPAGYNEAYKGDAARPEAEFYSEQEAAPKKKSAFSNTASALGFSMDKGFFDHGFTEGIDYETTYFDEPEADIDEPLPGYEDGLSIYAEDDWFTDETSRPAGNEAAVQPEAYTADAAAGQSAPEETAARSPQDTVGAVAPGAVPVRKKVVKKKVVRRVVKKPNS